MYFFTKINKLQNILKAIFKLINYTFRQKFVHFSVMLAPDMFN